MAIELQTSLSALEQLKTIDSMARSSSGKIAGNIGLLNGHVVKFNTHWNERLFSKTTDEMRDASNALRDTLKGLVGDLFRGNRAKIDELSALIDGKGARTLLDRAVVARVVDEVAASKGDRVRSSAEDVAQLSSKGLSTAFSTVRADVAALSEQKQERQAIYEQLRIGIHPFVDRLEQTMEPPKDRAAWGRMMFQGMLESGLRNLAQQVQEQKIDIQDGFTSLDSDYEQIVRIAASMGHYHDKEL